MAELLTAIAIVMILEGALPFVSPRLWRNTFSKLIELSDGQIRFVGLIAIALGVVGLLLASHA
jgi:uncharacterized protein